MNRRVWSCVGLLSVVCFGSSSVAQTPPAAPPTAATGTVIPVGAQQAPDAAAFQGKIHDFVHEQFALLIGGANGKPVDIGARARAREKLISNCPRGVTPSFGSIYGKEVNAEAEAALNGAKTMEVRLNVAIVLSGVANNASAIEVEPQVRRLLDDRDAAVAYWAVKAAAPLVGVLIQSPKFPDNKLVPAIIACVKKHSGTDTVAGAIAEDAFRALAPQEVLNLSEADLAKDSLVLVDPVLDLFEYRSTLFNSELVPTPTAERPAAAFMSKNFSGMTPTQQKRTIQDLVNYITYLSARSPNYDADQKNAAKIDASKRDEMSSVHNSLRTAAGALVVICPDLSESSCGWFAGVTQISSTPDELVAHGAKLFTDIQATGKYPFVVAPKALAPMALPVPAKTPAPATPPVATGA